MKIFVSCIFAPYALCPAYVIKQNFNLNRYRGVGEYVRMARRWVEVSEYPQHLRLPAIRDNNIVQKWELASFEKLLPSKGETVPIQLILNQNNETSFAVK